ncbi:DNA polymerase III subunit chi [Herbaspirillum lusitanum]|jgi:DNA polymerase-3 subunit chi|uniref:DNA polymerase III subunit chi n=1 Tax=Herbaspirillum lusitanum TaxID=213312 RepID=A0ABW9ABY6_9BURK
MTRIDFHSNVPQKLAYVCRLVRKARGAQNQIVLRARDRNELAQLDQALWTFSELDFLPHVIAGSPQATQTPIILTADDDVELPHHQVLINLSGQTPAHFARFERMFEIISDEEADKAAGRERYRFYKERGYPLSHFVAS